MADTQTQTVDPLKRHRVRVTGKADAPRTLVFIHGFGTDQSAWKPVSRAFLEDHRIVVYDHAGTGNDLDEPFDFERYTGLEAYAHDLVDICTALELKDAIAVGASMGAMIAVLAALRRPGLFRRLILVGGSARYLDDDGYRGGLTPADLEGMYGAMTANYQAWAAGFAPHVLGADVTMETKADFVRTLGAIRPDIAQRVARTIFESDHRRDVAQLERPTLILQTRQDIAVPMEAAEFLHRSIRDSRLQVLKASGHLPHLTAPREVVAAMRAWLAT